MIKIKEGLTFNDVLLEPKFSKVRSRKRLDISTKLTNRIRLKTPIISSNMDTVTEDEMAISMACNGGIGIIHRFISVEDQVDMVKRVKRYMNYKITNPYTIKPEATIWDFKNLVKEKKVKGFPVVDDENILKGIVTNRDVLFSSHEDLIKDIMTPINKLIYANYDIDLDEAYEIMKKHKIEKLPLVKDGTKLTGLITIKDILRYKEMNRVSTVDNNGQLRVGAAVGVKMEDIRVDALVKAGVDVLVVDVAHGHNVLAGEMIKRIKEKYPDIDVIAGNVATAEGTKYLIESGADCVKVGIGLGSICTTRIITGCGVPQLTALLECVNEAKKYGIPIISDGGNGGQVGNIAKALATGASTVMLGNFLAGTDESPGKILVKDNKRVKLIRGMSGYGANISRRQNIELTDDISDVIPEGVDAYIPYKGSVKDVLFQIYGGIKSCMSYCGAHNLEQLSRKAEFIRITDAGRKNSNHHGVSVL